MSTARLRVLAGAYRDSLMLLSATRAMVQSDGVEWATAVMALPANVADLAADGFTMSDLDSADANDLVLAVRAADAAAASAALDNGGAVLLAEPGPADQDRARQAPPTIAGAVARNCLPRTSARHRISGPRLCARRSGGRLLPARARPGYHRARAAGLPTLAASGPLTATWQRGCASAPEPPADR